ncbi:protein involved in polysaccharide export, contains SLBB domain of the beta-grasp fold [Saccharicrinis carchari]|uniref:Protein involved in polysaccharide export, contains SLBB domain of the beta-grasp fold n=1 Tax=Saccharicrinis carchari TaxID=1168039 RepID=A0A521EVT1_SACCC|nr:SLBB domain-containing protein [Saccharicrinis carchari]SMO88027.1 protein involved in polysaccharide export, contains SLBB domain of the beta-grasp fold [Saccharicrinis carchari]
MKIKFCLLTLIVFSLFAADPVAQNTNPKDVNVSALTNSEIGRIVAEMEKRGLSEQEALALARARGMSESQIRELKQKIEEYVRMNGEKGSKTPQYTDELEPFNEGFSTKSPIDSAKIDQRIFGFSFFNNENLSFEPGVNSAVSPGYLIGNGDELTVDVWGASQQSYQLQVDRSGNINIPNIGPISVGGLSLETATKKIKSKLVLIYRDLEASTPRTFASVNIGDIKPINVNVIGEVFAPGTYTLSGASTLFNALYLAGGPNPSGSFREIKLLRDGNVISRLDVYDYLINGNSAVNVRLRDADVILVSPYIKRVVMEGELKRTGLFEAKDGETVKDIINFAGGFTEDAYTHRLQLYRKTGRDMLFKDVLLNDANIIGINNGDSIVVGKIIERFQNMATIKGAVYRPGDYEVTEGLKLSELIQRADGVREDASLYRGLITRVKDDWNLQSIAFDVKDILSGKTDVEIKKDDIISISSIHDLTEFKTVRIYGEVQKPNEYDYKEGMTVADLVYEAGGFLKSASDAYIEVARKLSVEEGSAVSERLAHVAKIKVPRNLQFDPTEASYELQPFDQVFIRKLPGYSKPSIVKITGEVAYAGEYSLTSTKERVSDLIDRAGGLTPDAYPEGAMLTRRVRISEKQKRLRAELLERDSTLVFTDMDFEVVGISLSDALEKRNSRDDVFLKDGDELSVPKNIQTVKISGEVLNPISSNYVQGKSLKSYIWDSGGFGMQAKKGKVYVVYPNGSASGTKGFLFFRNYPKVTPGSEIIVPLKPEREGISPQMWISIGSAMASIGLTIATIANMNR